MTMPKIGSQVKVVFSTDSTFDYKHMGKTGKVVHYDFDCGCGQSMPNDAMSGVKFSSEGIEEFWKEELQIV